MTTSALGPPLLGALLRMPVDVTRVRMLEALHRNGFDDLIPAHLIVLGYPGPDGRRPGEIAVNSGLSKQVVNYHLGQLESFGYLERAADPDDQRSRRVHLTARGHAAMATIRSAVRELEREWARQIGAEDVESLRALLIRLAEVL